MCLIIQIITGVTLAMHYNPSVLEAFNSVEHIMRDVNNGWLIRYLHSNTASAFFFLVYLHIGRGLYYGSYKAPRTLVWTIGTVIFILMMATAFLGYVLPYGQMSLWGATVITNLMSAIPWVGQDIVEFIWGGFSVNNATLNRFFALHFVLPFVLAALALMHLIALHDSAGSGNPLGVSGNYDRLPFAPYFIFKDLITIFLFIIILSVFVFFMPNVLGDSENYVMANPMQTPPAIVPEWYLLPFYAILRSIPNKLLGVIAMFSAILILLVMPFTDLSRSRGLQFRPLSKIAFYIFVANFLILMQLGAKHVESPFIEFGQISTVLYFAHFLIIVPLVSLLENSLIELHIIKNNIKNNLSNLLTCLGMSICVYISIKVPHLYLFHTFEVMYFTPVLAGFCGLVYMTFKTNYFKQRAPYKWELIISSFLPIIFTVLFMYVTDEYLDITVNLLQEAFISTMVVEGEQALYVINPFNLGPPPSPGSASNKVYGHNNYEWRLIVMYLEHSIQNTLSDWRSFGCYDQRISFQTALNCSILSQDEKNAVKAYYHSYYPNATHYNNLIWGRRIGRTHISAMNKLARSPEQGPNSSDEESSDE